MRTWAKFVLAGLVGAVAAGAWLARPQPMDRGGADARAQRVLAAFVADTDDIPGHFLPRPTIAYTDGWDYRWAYAPCAEVAELRVFIARTGAARITATPDCERPDSAPARIV